MTMANIDWFGLAAALLGAAGTALLYKGSFAFVQLGGFFVSDDLHKKAQASNARRLKLQRAGLCLLLGSFIVQGLGTIF